ncbi:MAG: DUF2085 domain-containing protein [Theionarchaea archaeon]|nr:MAG: hypothetical protein AYK18_01820 [Theionarchaea archaeon DG-70]MBU7010506.1 DUF2085 domain-containing protein [Theionarchaea archaeon]
MTPKKVYFLFLLLSASAVVIIFLAPYAAYTNHPYISHQCYHAFSSLCHQRPERSFFLWGYPMGVCARCTFFYIGILTGMIAYPLRFGKGISFKVVVGFGIPMIVDGATQLLFRESTNEIRAVTGFLLGVILPFYVMPKFFEALE